MTSRRHFLRVGCLTILGLILPVSSVHAAAEIRQVSLNPTEDTWVLNSAFGLQLSASLTDAVNHGIPLVFQIQSQIRRPRWYWVDEALFSGHADRRLTYNALVRNYRVTEGQDGRNFQSLQDALDYVARPVSWTVPGGRLRAGEPVEILVRFRLDPAFLPKPFQVVSFGDRDWRLDSDWRTTRLNVPIMMGAK